MFLQLIAVVASCLSLAGAKTANASGAYRQMPALGLSDNGEEVQFNLIDGEDADIQRYPFYAMIVKKKSAIKTIKSGAKLKLFCGSSLIHPRFILTAFHCFKKKPFPSAWVAVFHVVDRCHPVGFRAVEVANIFFHMGSTTSSFAKINDLALAELKTVVTDITPVNLPDSPPVVGRVGMLIGLEEWS
uniref:Urokinase-type plasminogen activator n=1 Tax=Lygus hesperus TaxID=30085 RepID=A0A0A9X510_LYGHE